MLTLHPLHPPAPSPEVVRTPPTQLNRTHSDSGGWLVTCYTAGEGFTGTTATGRQVRVGYLAVDPTVIPLHSTVTVAGFGTYQAEDTGGAVKGHHVDIYGCDANTYTHASVAWSN